MNTKRKVMCIFSLVLYLLAACTILSDKIEEEMTTLVRVEKKTSSKRTGRSITLESRSIFIDEEGNHLYEVKEGSGWKNGLRIYEVPSFGLDAMGGEVSLWGVRDYVFIRSASRHPQEGELAEVVEGFETVNDQYLLYYHDGIPNVRDFPSNTELIAQSDNAFLLDVKDASLPFFPHLVKTQTVVTDMADCIFSLTEAEMFLNELPKVACVFSLIFVGVGIWLVSCCLNIRKCKIASLGWLNITIVIASLCFVQWALKGIDLPASILPSNNIFQLDYYWAEYSVMIDELKILGLLEHSLIKMASQIMRECKYIMLTGIMVSCGIACAEIIVLRVDQLLVDKR